MKPSDELFKLIKSLTKSEKRYFKLFSSLQSGEKNYMKIFDVIALQKDYDEVTIKRKFAKDTFVKHFASEKNQLYSLILKSLRGFYAEKSADSILREKLKDIELLYDRDLYFECVKSLKKAKEIALHHEKFQVLLTLIDKEKKLIEIGFLSEGFISFHKEKNKYLAQLRNEIEYEQLYAEIIFILKKEPCLRTKKEEETILGFNNHSLMLTEKKALSLKAKTSYYFIKGYYEVIKKESINAIENLKKGIDLIESHSFLVEGLPSYYIEALAYLVSLLLEEQESALLYANKLKSLSEEKRFSSLDMQLALFVKINNATLSICLSAGQFDRVIKELIPEIEEGLIKFNTKISKKDELLFYYNIAKSYFLAGNLKQALKYINLVLNITFSTLCNDVYTIAKCLNLVIHYELGNYDLLSYTIKSTVENTGKKQFHHKFEEVFLKNIQKIIQIQKETFLLSAFFDFKIQLEKILSKPHGEIILKQFNFISWLDGKIDKKGSS